MSAPEGVDPETGEIVKRGPSVGEVNGIAFPEDIRLSWEPMNEQQARESVRRIRFYGNRFSQEIIAAHDGQAHKALGYSSWEAFCASEFGITRQRAGQLIEHARKLAALADVAEIDPNMLAIPEGRTRAVSLDEALAVLEAELAELPEHADIVTKADLLGAVVQRLNKAAKPKPALPQGATTVAPSTISPSQVPAPGAGESGGEVLPSDPPAATSPEPVAGDSGPDRDGAESDAPASNPETGAADERTTPGSGDGEAAPPIVPTPEDHAGEAPDVEATQDAESSPSSPTSDPEPISSAGSGSLDRAQVSTAFAAALTLLTFDPLEAAGLLVGAERDERAQDCERITDWLRVHHDAVMDRGLAVVR